MICQNSIINYLGSETLILQENFAEILAQISTPHPDAVSLTRTSH